MAAFELLQINNIVLNSMGEKEEQEYIYRGHMKLVTAPDHC